jgi:hypothetical protein
VELRLLTSARINRTRDPNSEGVGDVVQDEIHIRYASFFPVRPVTPIANIYRIHSSGSHLSNFPVSPPSDRNRIRDLERRKSWFPGDDAAFTSTHIGASNNQNQVNTDASSTKVPAVNHRSWFPGDDRAYMNRGVGWASRVKLSSEQGTVLDGSADSSKKTSVHDKYAWLDLEDDGAAAVSDGKEVAAAQDAS